MTQEATIRRGVRNARYAAIPNHVFEDSRLSMEARWLLGYLLSKPDNWTVVIGDIIKKGNCGRDKARKMIAELVEFGYAEREQIRDDGKFGSSILVIYDEPSVGIHSDIPADDQSVAFLPQTDLPATAMPAPVLPAPVKSAPSNNLDLVITENQNLREGGREAEEGQEEPEEAEDTKSIEAAGWRLLKNWPGFDGMPKKPALGCWMKLSAEDRKLAAGRFQAWVALLKEQKKSHVPAPSTYFLERLWLAVPAMQEAARPKNVIAAAYGKLWGATRLAELISGPTGPISAMTYTERMLVEQGKFSLDDVVAEKRRKMGWPAVNTMHERARSRQGWLCPLALEEAAHGFTQVHRDSELLKAWRREHDRRNWPFPDAGGLPDWIYFPPIDETQGDLDIAVRDAVDRFSDMTHTLKQRGRDHDDAA